MTHAYKELLRLYPADIRFAYGSEMVHDFEQEFANAYSRGRAALARFMLSRVLFLLCDAAAERMNSLYSHRTFHGRGRPNPAAVRPPNSSKQEWFQIGPLDASVDKGSH